MAKIEKRLVHGAKSMYIIEYKAYSNKTANTWDKNKKTISQPIGNVGRRTKFASSDENPGNLKK